MNRFKSLSPAAVALAAALAAPWARAGDGRVHWSVHVGIPLPVITVPVPRIDRVPIVVHPGWRDRDHDGVPDWRDRHDDRRHSGHRPHGRADRDRDGVPDWRDPYDDRRYPGHRPQWRVDRDRDGLPDWRDPYDNRRDWHRDARPGWRHGG